MESPYGYKFVTAKFLCIINIKNDYLADILTTDYMSTERSNMIHMPDLLGTGTGKWR